MENEELFKQLRQLGDDIKDEIKRSNKSLENKMLVYVLVAAILLYALLK